MSAKQLISIIIILLMLCSCGSAEAEREASGDEASLSEEEQNFRNFNRMGSLMTKDVASQTLYFMNKSSGAGQYLAYADLKAEVTGLLCGKAECQHNNTSCNAFLGS